MAPSGIKPVTFWLVAQCLNQMRHRVLLIVFGPAGPTTINSTAITTLQR
jgi:hypothetical protein